MGKRAHKYRGLQSSSVGGKRLGDGPIRACDVPDGFERVKEAGDGNCLFHALARQALGDPRLASQARKEICDWMESNLPQSAARNASSALSESHWNMIVTQRRELLPAGVDKHAPILRYVQKMRRNREWGTGLEALCCAYCYGRAVHVWSPAGFSELRPPFRQENGQQCNMSPIRLLHNGRNHWDSLQPKADSPEHIQPAARNSAHEISVDGHDDTMLALVLSASLAETEVEYASEESLPYFVPADDEQDLRRTLAASAAEERRRLAQARGIGGWKPQTFSDDLQAPSSSTASPSTAHAPTDPIQADSVSVGEEQVQTSHNAGPRRNRWTRRLAAGAPESVGSEDRAARSAVALLADGMPPEVSACIAALSRIGFSDSEAAAIVVQSECNVEQVKALYAIEWDDSGRTVQMPFTS